MIPPQPLTETEMQTLTATVAAAVGRLQAIAKQVRAAHTAKTAPPITVVQKGDPPMSTVTIHKALRGQSRHYDKLCNLAESIMFRDRCDEHQAMRKALQTPEGSASYAAYRQEGRVVVPPDPVSPPPVKKATVESVLDALVKDRQRASTPHLSYGEAFAQVVKTAEGEALYGQYCLVQKAVQLGKAVTPSPDEHEVEQAVDALLKVPGNAAVSRTEAYALVLQAKPALLQRLAQAARVTRASRPAP